MAPKVIPPKALAKRKARATYFSEPSNKPPMSEATSNLTSIEADDIRVFDAVLKKYVDIRSVELLDPEYVAGVDAALGSKTDKTTTDNSSVAWSSGLAGDALHVLSSGTNALEVRKSTGSATASFQDNGVVSFYNTTYVPSEASLAFSAGGNLSDKLGAKAPLESPAFTGPVTGISKAMVGLSSADDTSDLAKPLAHRFKLP